MERPESCFPRGRSLPKQSPKFWVREKDRYLRQLLISDIQELTGRDLIVYFTAPNGGYIESLDADDLSEILMDVQGKEVDLLIQTVGGSVDACEKLICLLGHYCAGYRVIVPGSSKSAGTVIALSSDEIVMGVHSELGPIDPQVSGYPAEIYAEHHEDPVVREYCHRTVLRMKFLASTVLADRMMRGQSSQWVDDIVARLSTGRNYLSHGAVIDARHALELGLKVRFLSADDPLWRRLWLLYCMYDFDTQRGNISKIFEGARNSLSRVMPARGKNEKRDD